jgi:GNAT superfamily N-acetyltransferase
MNIVLENKEAPALELMQRVLRDGQPFADEYPLVFQAEFPGRVIALGEGEEVRSACAVLTREFLMDGTRVRGGLIGSVSTDPAWRDQGLATRLLMEAEAALQSEGCAFALLWADDPDFYLKRGYGPIGTEEDFLIPSALTSALPRPAGVRPLTAADALAIHGLYERHVARVERTTDETAALMACPDMVTLGLERDGEVVAYACRGRGRDLPDFIHEWGGDSEDVLALIRAHLEQRFPKEPGHLFLMAPTSASDLCYRLVTAGAKSQRGMLGLGKILDREAAVALLDERLGDAGKAELVEREDGCHFQIRGPEAGGHVDDDGVLAVLLGVTDVRDQVRSFLTEFGLQDAPLPIEPFAWGLDSI